MKFKINRDHFANGLSQVLNVVGSKATMPILSNVLIEAEKDQISLSTTNLDLGIRCRIKAEVKETGAVTLPVKRLASIVKELPNIDVSVDASPNHQVKLSSGGSTFRIMGIGREEFPPLPEFGDEKAYTLEQAELSAMLRSVAYAQSIDETRYILNGVYFNFRDGKLSLVATDGRRLAVIAKEMEIPAERAGAIILPAKTVLELSRLLDKGEKVKINFNDRRCAFQIATGKDTSGLIDSVYLYSKVVEGSYPNYQQVIPKETHQRIKLERELFLQCVHRAALVCSEKSNSIRIKLSSNLLEITAQSPDFGEAHESMAIGYSGPDLQVAFNPAFIMDPLRALSKDEVFFEVKDDVSPGVFKTLESFICVIMPVRFKFVAVIQPYYLIIGAIVGLLVFVQINQRVGSPVLAIIDRWFRWLGFAFGGALFCQNFNLIDRPYWVLVIAFFLFWFLGETLYNWLAISALSVSPMPLFPRYVGNASGEEWPVQPRLLKIRSWLRAQGFRQVQALKAEVGASIYLRVSVYQDEAATVRVQVTFLPQPNGAIIACYSLTSMMADGGRIVTDNLYIPFGGFYPENWFVIRKPWCRSLPRLLARHRSRLAKAKVPLVSFSTEPLADLNAVQRELDSLNTELGFLHAHSDREDLGKITQEGRYRVWKEIWMLNYLGRSARYR